MKTYLNVDDKHGRATVLKCLDRPEIRKSRWVFKCDCGSTFTVSADNVLRGRVSQCHSCVIRQRSLHQSKTLSRILQAKPEAGNTDHPQYRVWAQMIQRCTNPNNAWYHRYGARGIIVCPEWLEFINYIKYVDEVLGPKPSTIHSIDRIDNDKNYEPGNLRWATPTIQANNRG